MDYGIYEQASGGREWFYPDYYACNYYDELSSMYGKDLVYYYLDYACYGVSENKQARTILPGNEKYLQEQEKAVVREKVWRHLAFNLEIIFFLGFFFFLVLFFPKKIYAAEYTITNINDLKIHCENYNKFKKVLEES